MMRLVSLSVFLSVTCPFLAHKRCFMDMVAIESHELNWGDPTGSQIR